MGERTRQLSRPDRMLVVTQAQPVSVQTIGASVMVFRAATHHARSSASHDGGGRLAAGGGRRTVAGGEGGW